MGYFQGSKSPDRSSSQSNTTKNTPRPLRNSIKLLTVPTPFNIGVKLDSKGTRKHSIAPKINYNSMIEKEKLENYCKQLFKKYL